MANEIEMMTEWQAWQQVVRELASLGLDINEQDRLNALLVFWGEAVAWLRVAQPEDIRERALQSAERKMARI